MVMSLMEICDASRDLVPFDQFKKREKYSCTHGGVSLLAKK